MPVKPIPDGYHSLTPYLIVQGAAKAIDFYTKAFGASELFRLGGPGGTVAHAELRLGDSVFMLGEECPEHGAKGPRTIGGSPMSLLIYVTDVDAAARQAVAAGATVKRPVQDQFYGDRSGMVACPFGYRWFLDAAKEAVGPEEMQKRWTRMLEGGQA